MPIQESIWFQMQPILMSESLNHSHNRFVQKHRFVKERRYFVLFSLWFFWSLYFVIYVLYKSIITLSVLTLCLIIKIKKILLYNVVFAVLLLAKHVFAGFVRFIYKASIKPSVFTNHFRMVVQWQSKLHFHLENIWCRSNTIS